MEKLKYFILILLTATVLMVGLTGCNQSNSPDGVDINEKPIHISQYKGKWIVLNYWAIWCKPCLEELPELDKLSKNHQDKVAVLGVSFDSLSNDDISTFSKSLGLTFPMLMSFDLEKFGVNNVSTLPVTFLFSPDGKLVKTLNGPQTEAGLLKEMAL
ncbi:MAG: thioredoxin [Gammaproteobacteria bacterium]|jgi:thiol-disulfide isomerase/thioredoxin|nr:thioredoxin [Gammaproteobacteria bacterium]